MLASGAAALMYQVLWLRLLSLSIGNTSAAIALVLTAFFSGLALGAWFSERLLTSTTPNIKSYLVLEVIIGLAGLTLLPILLNLDSIVAQWGSLAHANSIKFALVMLLLGIPTIAIGATFPVMVSFLGQGAQPGRRLGHLYALNTAGGVMGAVLSGFVFIPHWGLDGSTYVAAGLNFAIVILGLGFMQTLKADTFATETSAKSRQSITDPATRKLTLIVLFGTGMIALACEVAWTKYLGIYVHTTLYGFAAILAIFLSGLAIGAWAIKFWLDKLNRPGLWITVGLIILGISLLLTRVGLNILPDVDAILTDPHAPLSSGIKYILVFALLFPATFIFGALFSLSLRIASSSDDSLRHPVGKAYAINTLGGIVGAVGAGLWVIPSFGSDSVLKICAIIPLLLALMFLVPTQICNATKDKRVAFAAAVILLFGINSLLPPLDFRPVIKASAYYFDPNRNARQQPILFLKEGVTGVISVTARQPQLFMLQRDGLPEALVHLQRPYIYFTETLLGLLPYLLHDNPRNAFVVGFGGGTTIQALTTTKLESIRLLELEPVMIEAGEAIRNGPIPALQDPRVELTIDDARQRLLLENQHYDLIISQPSHPWLAGSANMFSREFFRIARSRLTDNGIYSQWLNLFNMDATTLHSILQAFFGEFPYGMSMIVFNESGLLLLGSQQPIHFDYQRIQQRLNFEPAVQAALSQGAIQEPQDLLRYFALSRNEALQAAGDTQPNTDRNLLSEVRLAGRSEWPTGEEDPYRTLREHSRLDLTDYYNVQELETRYRELADYFQYWNNPQRAQMARMQAQRLMIEKKLKH